MVAGVEQPQTSYLEFLEDSDGNVVGSYQVTIDLRALRRPFRVLVVRSTGRVGAFENPEATRTVEMEVDMEISRATYFTVINWRDLGAL